MGAVWLRSRAELRHRWKAWLAVALLAGIGGGIAIGAFAAADRVENTYPEFVEAGHPMDVLVPGSNPFGLVGGVELDEVARLPEVAETADASANLLFAGYTPSGRLIGPGDVFPVAAAGNALGTTFEKFTILDGRAARPFAIREATASFVAAQELGLEVGDTLRLHFFTQKRYLETAGKLLTEFEKRLESKAKKSSNDYAKLADGPDMRFKIVGIEASPGEFPPLPADISPVVHLTPAFYQRWNDELVQTPLLYTRLTRGVADIPSFERRVERLAGDEPVSFVTTRATQQTRVQRTIEVQAMAMRIFALIVLAAFVCLILQTISRQVRVESRDDASLRTMGMSTGQIFTLPMLWAAIAAVPAAILAGVISVLLSPFGVIGLARQADPDPGIALDGLVTAIGVGSVLLGIPLITLWPALRRARAARGIPTRDRPGRPSRVARWLSRSGAPPSSAVGVAFAYSPGRGFSAVPVQSAIIGFTLGVGLLVATLGFGASLQRVLDSPPLYGWTWDIRTGAPALPDIGGLVIPALQADSDIESAAAGTIVQVDLEGDRVDAMALHLVKGQLRPAMTEGRPPRQAGDLVVGNKTLRDIGAEIGDTVTARIGKRSARVKIVGTAVFPPFGDAGQFGSGVLMTYAQLTALVPQAKQNVFLLKLESAETLEREFVHMRDAMEPLPTRRAQAPTDLDNLDSSRGLQYALVAILAALAAATLAHTLVSSVRRRRRSIALLRTMGFDRRQVAAVVVVQALSLVVAALAIGTVLGVIGGRMAWALFTGNIGIDAAPVQAWGGVLVLVLASLGLAVGVAAIPAVLASRTHPAEVLRDR